MFTIHLYKSKVLNDEALSYFCVCVGWSGTNTTSLLFIYTDNVSG